MQMPKTLTDYVREGRLNRDAMPILLERVYHFCQEAKKYYIPLDVVLCIVGKAWEDTDE